MYVRQLFDIATRKLSIGIGGFHISIGRSNVRCRFIVIEFFCATDYIALSKKTFFVVVGHSKKTKSERRKQITHALEQTVNRI
jgi:hypothetical protein